MGEGLNRFLSARAQLLEHCSTITLSHGAPEDLEEANIDSLLGLILRRCSGRGLRPAGVRKTGPLDHVLRAPRATLAATDHGGLTMALGTLLEAAGKGPDEIYTIGFDLCPAVLEGIREGWIDLVLDQQPFLQGYLPILQICLINEYQVSGLHIDTGGGFVHQGNVEVLAPLVEQQIR